MERLDTPTTISRSTYIIVADLSPHGFGVIDEPEQQAMGHTLFKSHQEAEEVWQAVKDEYQITGDPTYFILEVPLTTSQYQVIFPHN